MSNIEEVSKTISTDGLSGGGKLNPAIFPGSFLDDESKQPQYALRMSMEFAEKVFGGEKRLLVYSSVIDESSEHPFYVMVDDKIVGAIRVGHGFEIVNEDEFNLMSTLHGEEGWADGMYGYRVIESGMFDSFIPVYMSDKDNDSLILSVEKMTGVVDAQVWKSAEERIVAAAVLVPGRTDLQDEIYDEDTVRAAAYYFLEHYLQDEDHGIDVRHEGEIVPDAIRVLQSYVLDEDKTFAVEVPALSDDHPVKEKTEITFPKGTWIMYARVISDTLWDKIKTGEFTGWSIAGLARVRELSKMLKAV